MNCQTLSRFFSLLERVASLCGLSLRYTRHLSLQSPPVQRGQPAARPSDVFHAAQQITTTLPTLPTVTLQPNASNEPERRRAKGDETPKNI